MGPINMPQKGFKGHFGYQKYTFKKIGGSWQEQNGIIFQVMFAILRIGVIKKNFCLSLQEIDVAGYNGCLKLRNGIVFVY
jgi:hypothetical protein